MLRAPRAADPRTSRRRPDPGHWDPPDLTTPGDTDPPKPDATNRVTISYEKREITVSGADGFRPWYYGRHKLGGSVLYTFQPTSFLDEFWIVIGIGRGEIDSLVELRVNDKPASQFGSSLSYWFYTGTAVQAINADLLARDPSWNEALTSDAYCVVKLANVSSSWTELPNFSFEIKGKKCLDPRTGLTVYTENPVIQLYDFLRHAEGKNLALARIGEARIIAAADVADQITAADQVTAVTIATSGSYTVGQVAGVVFSAPPVGVTATGTAVMQNGKVIGVIITNGGSGYLAPPTVTFTGSPVASDATGTTSLGEKRFAAHVAIMDNADVEDYVKTFRLLVDGFLPFTNGKYELTLDQPGASSDTYTDDDIISIESAGREEPRDKPNHIVVSWVNPENGWKSETVEWKSPELLAGTEDARTATYSLPWIHRKSIAGRAARYLGKRLRYDFRMSVVVKETKAARNVGDLISLTTLQYGIAGQVFRIVARTRRPDNSYLDELLEYNADVYSDEISNATPKIASSAPDPFATPATLAGGAATEEIVQLQPGNYRSRVRITGTQPAFIGFDVVEVWERHSTVSAVGPWTELRHRTEARTLPITIEPVIEEVWYEFHLFVRSHAGIKSAAAVIAIQTFGKTAVPTDVPLLVGAAISGKVHLNWQHAADRDLVGYEIRRLLASDTAGSLLDKWSRAKVVTRTSGQALSFEDEAPFDEFRYLIRAFDSGMRYSANPTEFVIHNFPPKNLNTFGVSISTVLQSGGHGSFSRRNGLAVVEHFADGSHRVLLAPERTFQDIQDEIDAEFGPSGTMAQWLAVNPWKLCFPLPLNATGEIYNQSISPVYDGTALRNQEFRYRSKASERIGDDNPKVTAQVQAIRAGAFGDVATVGKDGGEEGLDLYGLRLSTNSQYGQESVHSVGSPSDPLITVTQRKLITELQSGKITTLGDGTKSVVFSQPMGTGEEPHVQLHVISAANVVARLTAVSSTGFSCITINPSTGAAVGAIEVQYAAEDHGLGGSLTTTLP